MVGTKYQTLGGTDALPTEYVMGTRKPYVPRGDVTICFGPGKVGKGRLTAWFIKQVVADGGTVVGAWPEDHPEEQLRPRLDAAGLTEDELDRVINITRLPNTGRFKLSADLTHVGHLPLLREEILPELAADGHDVRLLVLDPLAALVGWGSIQTNAGARRAVEPIQDMCMDTGIACWLVAHTTKAGVLQGSAGLLQAVRLAYRLSKDRNDPTVKILSVEEANNLPEQEDIRFKIEDYEQGNAKVVFLDQAYIDRHHRSWRTPIYKAVLVTPDGKTRELGVFSDLDKAKLMCSAQPETPGPALTWKQHKRADGAVDMFTITAPFMYAGQPHACGISDVVKVKPLTASMVA